MYICTCVCVTGSRDELIQHCLIALRESLPELTDHNHSGYIATVGVLERLLYYVYITSMLRAFI